MASLSFFVPPNVVLQPDLTPPFVIASGVPTTFTMDPTRAVQNLKVLITGAATSLVLNGTWNGCNGVLVVDKRVAGVATLQLPASGFQLNNANSLSATGGLVPLSTGSDGCDVLAFVYDETRSYWTASTPRTGG